MSLSQMLPPPPDTTLTQQLRARLLGYALQTNLHDRYSSSPSPD